MNAPTRCDWWIVDATGLHRCRALVVDLNGSHAKWHAHLDGHIIPTERTV